MKRLIFLILLPFHGFGQEKIVDINDYSRLVIVDSYNNNYVRFIGVIYCIDLSSHPFMLYQTEKYYQGNPENKRLDSLFRLKEAEEFDFSEAFIPNQDTIMLGTVDDSLVYELVSHLNNPKGPESIGKVFDQYGLDAAWLAEKKDSLLQLCLSGKRKIKKREATFIDAVLSDISSFREMANYKIFRRTTSHYPGVYISFEPARDSLIFYNQGQYIFLLPWMLDSTYVNFDPEISMIIGRLLPRQNFNINKKYLLPTREFVVQSILEEIKFKANFVKKGHSRP